MRRYACETAFFRGFQQCDGLPSRYYLAMVIASLLIYFLLYYIIYEIRIFFDIFSSLQRGHLRFSLLASLF